jgi:hypothetical protein
MKLDAGPDVLFPTFEEKIDMLFSALIQMRGGQERFIKYAVVMKKRRGVQMSKFYACPCCGEKTLSKLYEGFKTISTIPHNSTLLMCLH